MWVSEAGMVENVDQIIKEYKDSRKLQVKNKQPCNSIFHFLEKVYFFKYMYCVCQYVMNFIILQPLRICILGPPASGKTTVCQKLCEFYKLHHIKIKDVIDEALEELVRPNLVQNGWKNDTLGQLYRTVDFCVRHYFLLCKPYICKRKMSESLVQLKNK